ncbi:MAG: thiopeptide-type bacteriocin biosynthesis protein [Bacteroidales bacterium]|nr:thiopeptide-type bacteriocin biosynthesis protein [Bacteroidales bacterium]
MKNKNLFLPGDEWLYYRIYCGHSTAGKLLREEIYPLLTDLKGKELLRIWFFIRYADPEHHLRMRIKLTDNNNSMLIIQHLRKCIAPYVNESLIWKVEIGTYQPEYERYGTASISLVENLFFYDSLAYCSFTRGTGKKNDQSLWLYAILSADQLLQDFKFSLEEKKELLLRLSRSFGKEFGKNKSLAKQLSDKFRQNRLMIAGLFDGSNNTASAHHIKNTLNLRSEQNRNDVSAISALYASGKMEVVKDDLLASLMHMSMNRIFGNNNRLHEMLIYDLLHRQYRMLVATATEPHD